MRVLFVWFTALISIFMVTVGWLVGNTVVVSIASQALGDITGQGYSLLTLLEYIAAWWGPILDGVILLWAIINSQETDPTGRLLG